MLFSDEGGRLWVESTAVSRDGYALTWFDVDGTPLGRSRMPDRDPRVTPQARGNLLYLVTADTLEVQSIEIYEARIR